MLNVINLKLFDMKTVREYLEMDGGIIFNIAIFKRFSCVADKSYSEICGSFIEGVYQWADHNLDYLVDSENNKYYGWTIHFQNQSTKRVYIPKWVLSVKCKDFKHAKNLFNKYLLSDYKYNQSKVAMGVDYGY